MAPEDEDPVAFNDEDDDLEDTDDTDMDDDDEPASAAGDQPPPPPPATDLNSSASIQIQPLNPTPNPNFSSDPIPAPQNGAVQVTPVSSTAAGATVSGDLQSPDVKRPRIEERRPQPSTSLDESRRLFQRLWTDDDEIKILTRFLEFTSSRGTTFASHQYDTGPFYEQIKNELQLDFNKNQLIEKLRRLKKKYRNTATRMANHGPDFTFRSPHEKATYDIAKKIWSASIKRSRESDDEDLNPYANNTSDAGVSSDRKPATSRSRRRGRKRAVESLPATPMVPALPALPAAPPPVTPAPASSEGMVKVEVQTVPITAPVTAAPIQTPVQNPPNSTAVASPSIPTVIEETVKSCLSPIFKELLNSAVSAPPGLGINFPPLLNFGGNMGNLSDEKWKKQQILELEVYLKRVELIREQIESTLEELRASPVSGS